VRALSELSPVAETVSHHHTSVCARYFAMSSDKLRQKTCASSLKLHEVYNRPVRAEHLRTSNSEPNKHGRASLDGGESINAATLRCRCCPRFPPTARPSRATLASLHVLELLQALFAPAPGNSKPSALPISRSPAADDSAVMGSPRAEGYARPRHTASTALPIRLHLRRLALSVARLVAKVVAERVLARVGHVQEAILVLVLVVHILQRSDAGREGAVVDE